MTSSINNKPSSFAKGQWGFGLIELLVSISIMIMVTGIVLTQHSSFNSGTLLRSQAFDIGLRLREVQLSAVSAQTPGGTPNFRSLFGARFITAPTMASVSSYNVFSTPPTTGSLGTITQVGTDGIIDRRFQITCIQHLPSSNCVPDNTHIVFRRPNFDAEFFNNSGSALSSVTGVRIYVGLRGALGAERVPRNERFITVTRTGQISVQ